MPRDSRYRIVARMCCDLLGVDGDVASRWGEPAGSRRRRGRRGRAGRRHGRRRERSAVPRSWSTSWSRSDRRVVVVGRGGRAWSSASAWSSWWRSGQPAAGRWPPATTTRSAQRSAPRRLQRQSARRERRPDVRSGRRRCAAGGCRHGRSLVYRHRCGQSRARIAGDSERGVQKLTAVDRGGATGPTTRHGYRRSAMSESDPQPEDPAPHDEVDDDATVPRADRRHAT